MSEGAYPHAVPPPLPEAYRRSQSFAKQAAIFCLWSPFAAMAISFFGTAALRQETGDAVNWSQMILGATACLIILGGVALGIAALCQTGHVGQKGILGRAATGLAINAVLILMMAFGGVSALRRAQQRAVANRQALARVRESVNNAQDAARKELLSRDRPASGSGSARLDKMQQSLEDAAQTVKGSGALILQASAAYTAKLNELMKTYEKTVEDLRTAKVLAFDKIRQQADLADRRQVVERFLDANQALTTFVKDATGNYRAELQKQSLAPKQIESALAGFRTKADVINPTIIQIRGTDARIGKGMLDTLDLLKDNWGKWKYQQATAKVRFDEDAVRIEYLANLSEIENASALQRQLQTRLARLMSNPLKAGPD